MVCCARPESRLLSKNALVLRLAKRLLPLGVPVSPTRGREATP